MKGRDNFLSMKALIRSLVEVGYRNDGSDEGNFTQENLIKRVDKMEEFHKVGFPRHLGQGEI